MVTKITNTNDISTTVTTQSIGGDISTTIPSLAMNTYNHKDQLLGPILDSGSSKTNFRESDKRLLVNINSKGGEEITYGGGSTATSIGTAQYQAAVGISPVEVSVFRDSDLLESLASTNDFCEQGLAVVYTDEGVTLAMKEDIKIDQNKVKLFQAKRKNERLWRLPSTLGLGLEGGKSKVLPFQANMCMNVIHSELDADFVRMIHATMGSPTVNTLKDAVAKGWLGNLPRITSKMITRNPPYAMETSLGHLDKRRINQQSTKRKITCVPGTSNRNVTLMTENVTEINSTISPMIFTRLVDNGENLIEVPEPDDNEYTTDYRHQTTFGDVTGRFPITSRSGMRYILISTYMGYIHYQLLRSRRAEDLLEAYRETIKLFKGLGVKPKFQRLDNETSNILDEYFREEKIEFQYAVPHSHQSNIAERAIRTAKNHLLSMLATASDEFPKDLWDQAIPQAELTLNHLVSFKPDPTKSAYHGLHGHTWDFMAHPIAPFGIKVCIYVSTDERLTWDYHGLPGFYLGPASVHYRAFRVYVTSTESERVAESLDWFPVPYKMPGAAAEDAILMILDDLEKAITGISTNLSQSDMSEGTTQMLGTEGIAKTVLKPIRTLMNMYFRKPDGTGNYMVPTSERNEIQAPDRTTIEDTHAPTLSQGGTDSKTHGRWSTGEHDGEHDDDYVPEHSREKTILCLLPCKSQSPWI